MREKLKPYCGTYSTFTGVFVRYGLTEPERYGNRQKTVLLKYITNCKGEVVCEHVWVMCTGDFERLGNLRKGTTLKFRAKVEMYIKRDNEYRKANKQTIDYQLASPENIRIVKHKHFQKRLDNVIQA